MARRRNDNEAEKDERRVLLHIVKRQGEWQGKALDFNRQQEILFSSLEDLVVWLDQGD